MEVDPVAVYGAVLATVLAILQLRQTRLDRPRVRLELGALESYAYGSSGYVPDMPTAIEVSVINEGRRPTTVEHVGFILSDGCRMTWVLEEDDRRLEEGRTVHRSLPVVEITRRLALEPDGTRIVAAYAGFPGREKRVQKLSLHEQRNIGLGDAQGRTRGGRHAGQGHPANEPQAPERIMSGIPTECDVCHEHVTAGEKVAIIGADGPSPRARHLRCNDAVLGAAVRSRGK